MSAFLIVICMFISEMRIQGHREVSGYKNIMFALKFFLCQRCFLTGACTFTRFLSAESCFSLVWCGVVKRQSEHYLSVIYKQLKLH